MTSTSGRLKSAVQDDPPRLRVQVASDIHLEFIKRRFPGERVIRPLADADLLVLAGDIAKGLGVLDAFGDWPVPILYVIGNHERYGGVYDEDRVALRAACDGTNVVLLDQDVVTVGDLAERFPALASSRAAPLPNVRLIGCTLWTGYRYSACGMTHEAQMELAERALNDHRLIRLTTGPFDAQAALACHEADCAWLRNELAKPFKGDTLVITHHAPSERSVPPPPDPSRPPHPPPPPRPTPPPKGGAPPPDSKATRSPVPSSPICRTCLSRRRSGSTAITTTRPISWSMDAGSSATPAATRWG